MTHGIQGQMAYHAGDAAEQRVACFYERRGCQIAHRRWRGPCGEIDLVVRDGARVIFVEVKKSRDFARAAAALNPRQMARISASAEGFLAGEPAGSLTEMRIDVALVDATGAIDVLENALMAA